MHHVRHRLALVVCFVLFWSVCLAGLVKSNVLQFSWSITRHRCMPNDCAFSHSFCPVHKHWPGFRNGHLSDALGCGDLICWFNSFLCFFHCLLLKLVCGTSDGPVYVLKANPPRPSAALKQHPTKKSRDQNQTAQNGATITVTNKQQKKSTFDNPTPQHVFFSGFLGTLAFKFGMLDGFGASDCWGFQIVIFNFEVRKFETNLYFF